MLSAGATKRTGIDLNTVHGRFCAQKVEVAFVIFATIGAIGLYLTARKLADPKKFNWTYFVPIALGCGGTFMIVLCQTIEIFGRTFAKKMYVQRVIEDETTTSYSIKILA